MHLQNQNLMNQFEDKDDQESQEPLSMEQNKQYTHESPNMMELMSIKH